MSCHRGRIAYIRFWCSLMFFRRRLWRGRHWLAALLVELSGSGSGEAYSRRIQSFSQHYYESCDRSDDCKYRDLFFSFIGCSSVFVGLTMRQTFFSPGCSHLHLHILCHYAWRQGIRGTAQSKRQSTQTRRSCTVQGHLRTSSRDAATDHVATLDTVASRAHLEFLLQSTASSGLGAKSRTRGMVRVSIAPQQWRTVDDARRGD